MNTRSHLYLLACTLLLTFLGVCWGTAVRAGAFADRENHELSLWVEAPKWDPSGSSASDYFSGLVHFTQTHPAIRRILIRLEDPKASPVYYFPDDSTPAGSTLIGGLLLNPDFIATGAEVYLVPWLHQTNQEWDAISYPNPPATLGFTAAQWAALPDNLERAAVWIQLANEFVREANPTGTVISGLVYESEGAGEWSDKTRALPRFRDAFMAHLKAPTPSYSNTAASAFVLASASQFDFDTAGTGVVLQAIYPQMYNLTRSRGKNWVDVDAASAAASQPDFHPAFPDSLYTLCQKGDLGDPGCMIDGRSGGAVDLLGFKGLKAPTPTSALPANGARRIHLMFSGEQAGPPNNPHFWHASTLAFPNATPDHPAFTGIINAFGTENWSSWGRFTAFLESFSQNYFAAGDSPGTYPHFALFQYNLLPVTWNASTDLVNHLGTPARPAPAAPLSGRMRADTDRFRFVARKGQPLRLRLLPVSHSEGKARVRVSGPGLKKSLSASLPITLDFTPRQAATYRIQVTNRPFRASKRFVGGYILSLSGSEPPVRITQPGDSWASLKRVRPD